MNGAEIFNFTLKAVPKAIRELLDKAGLEMEDVDLFLFHQANQYMLEHLRKKLNIPQGKDAQSHVTLRQHRILYPSYSA